MTHSIALSSQSLAQSNSTTPVSTSSYLDRCVENLTSDKIANFERKGLLWKVASAVSIVAFFAIAIGTFIAVGFLAPASLPVAGISILFLAMPAAQQIKKFQDWSQEALEQASMRKDIKHIYTDLTNQSPQEIQRILMNMGILWFQIPGIQIQHPENLIRLTPLIAHIKHAEKQIEISLKKKEVFESITRSLSTVTTPAAKEKKTQSLLSSLNCEDEASRYKIHNAFIYAVLRNNPDYKGSLQDLGSLYNNSFFAERVIRRALNDPESNNIFTFNRPDLAPITFDEAKSMTVAQLSQRILAAMAA